MQRKAGSGLRPAVDMADAMGRKITPLDCLKGCNRNPETRQKLCGANRWSSSYGAGG